MRIAMVGGFAWEPKGTVRARAFPLAEELVRRGHQVKLLIWPYDSPKYSGEFSVREGVEIENLHAEHIGRWPTFLKQLGERVSAFRPDVLHMFKPKGFSGIAANKFLNGAIPVVIDSDDWEGWGGWNDVKRYPWPVKQWIDVQERSLLRAAKVVTVASKVLEQRAIELRGTATEVFYLPNSLSRSQAALMSETIREDAALLRVRFGIPAGVVIGYVGHYEEADDLAVLQELMIRQLSHSNATLVLIGEGEKRGLLLESFDRAGLRERVVALGALAYPDYLKVIHSVDVMCFPYPDTLIHRAKCSARILDFMGMAKPVLTTGIGENREYIQDGINGSLAGAADIDDCVGRLQRLVEDAALRARMGAGARETILSRFQWAHFAPQLENAYTVALNSSEQNRGARA